MIKMQSRNNLISNKVMMANSKREPTYEELEKRLAEAEELVSALRKHEVDAIVGEQSVAVVRLRKVEQQLAKARKAAELRAAELEAFSQSISHELRNPLNNIGAMAGVLEEHYGNVLDSDGQKCLRLIKSNVSRITDTVSGLLELSQVVRRELRLKKIDLSVIAEDFIAELRETDPERTVDVVIAKNMTATADSKLTRQALEHLLKNAWKYTRNTPNARIEIGMYHEDNQTVYFVKDNGAGFDLEHAEKVFEQFHTLHSQAKYPGTGLGLAVVRRIIQRHGGKIWAESEVGKGATFFFTLGEQG
ncbi:MAG: hypothetical protein GF401_10900 [Chitinivibrionales bacterium]|nr:hypothetical protein [Chitinivibrionales bacterium]